MGREEKGRGRGVGEGKEGNFPLPHPPPSSFFLSPHFPRVPNAKTPSRGLIFRSARTGTLATQAPPSLVLFPLAPFSARPECENSFSRPDIPFRSYGNACYAGNPSNGVEIKFEYVSGHLPANCFTEEIEIKDRVAIMLFKLKSVFVSTGRDSDKSGGKDKYLVSVWLLPPLKIALL